MSDQKDAAQNLTPGTKEHEEAVKAVISAQLKSLEALNDLKVIEAKNLQVGNAFLAFRFSG